MTDIALSTTIATIEGLGRLVSHTSAELGPPMSVIKKHAGNPLGDLRAESDHPMLDVAFYKTPDYLSLIESEHKTIVVGRRGAGKSALAYQLSKYWHDVPKIHVVELALEEDQVIGLGPLIRGFGDSYRLVSAGCKVAWRYCLAMETVLQLATRATKFSRSDETGLLARHVTAWRTRGDGPSGRLRKVLQEVMNEGEQPEHIIAELAHRIELNSVETALNETLEEMGCRCIILIDRLDEGYEPTDVGVGLVDGIVSGTISFHAKVRQVRPILFLRDNMSRTIATRNLDYSRNIEGQVLRLHWNDYHLMNMVSQRLKAAFGIEEEETNKVWGKCVARDLKGREGFQKCLQLTLYRPRDILVLLNEAFYDASKENRDQIIPDDVRTAGKAISAHRLADLHKEYSTIIPGLEYLTTAFANGKPELSYRETVGILGAVMCSDAYTTDVLQTFAILAEPIAALRALYGIGFIGIKDVQLGNVVFCHDGNSFNREIRPDDTFVVHPCYWMALNVSRDALSPEQAEEIHDEYDIAVTEDSAAQRSRSLSEIMSGMGKISLGHEGQKSFEEWCHRAIRTVFAGALRNVELCARDVSGLDQNVLALNLSRTESWTRIMEDYHARQVTFVPVNQQAVPRQVFQDAASALTGPNGKIVFLVTRDESTEMRKDGELAWVKEIYASHGVLVVKLTGRFLSNLLGKLRNPQKHDAVERAVNGTLDIYTRSYMKNVVHKPMPVRVDTTSGGDDAGEGVRVDVPAAECYGELAFDPATGAGLLRIFIQRPGAGVRAEACVPINLKDQAYAILADGIAGARKRCIDEMRERARSDGSGALAEELEPPDEQAFIVEWSQDDLAKIVRDKPLFAPLKKNEKDVIKTAIHRVKTLVTFSRDGVGLISTAEDIHIRRTTIPLRIRK